METREQNTKYLQFTKVSSYFYEHPESLGVIPVKFDVQFLVSGATESGDGGEEIISQ